MNAFIVTTFLPAAAAVRLVSGALAAGGLGGRLTKVGGDHPGPDEELVAGIQEVVEKFEQLSRGEDTTWGVLNGLQLLVGELLLVLVGEERDGLVNCS